MQQFSFNKINIQNVMLKRLEIRRSLYVLITLSNARVWHTRGKVRKRYSHDVFPVV